MCQIVTHLGPYYINNPHGQNQGCLTQWQQLLYKSELHYFPRRMELVMHLIHAWVASVYRKVMLTDVEPLTKYSYLR